MSKRVGPWPDGASKSLCMDHCGHASPRSATTPLNSGSHDRTTEREELLGQVKRLAPSLSMLSMQTGTELPRVSTPCGQSWAGLLGCRKLYTLVEAAEKTFVKRLG